jgi:hypothetical protein
VSCFRAKYLRQTLIFADYLAPEFNALFNKHLNNVSGKLKIKQSFEEGSIVDVIPQVQQVSTVLVKSYDRLTVYNRLLLVSMHLH